MHNPLKAVIFDMDGVITYTMPYHFQAWKIVFASSGVHVTREDIYKREGQKGIDHGDCIGTLERGKSECPGASSTEGEEAQVDHQTAYNVTED